MKSMIVMLAAATLAAAAEPKTYPFGPDSKRQPGVPQGKITQHELRSSVFPDTLRQYFVYIPAQYDGSEPAAVMVFQDGHAYVGEKGEARAPIVFDNLIHKGEMPVTVGIFINPGLFVDEIEGLQNWDTAKGKSNRSVEYDTLSATYAEMLEKEILPEVGKMAKLTDDPEMRAICGVSSGGICAFTVAWERPDLFPKVVSHVGSFTNIRGGHDYPSMVRKDDKRPIRVYLQGGSNDLDNKHGHWWLANLQMEKALAFAGYDHLFVGGEGGHGLQHGGAVLPDALRWIWRSE